MAVCYPFLAYYSCRYVWAKCDPDGDGKILRDELTPLLAAWKEVALQRTEQRMSIADEQEEERAKAQAIVQDVHEDGPQPGVAVRWVQ